MRDIPQIAKHAGILNGALLASLVALVVAVGTYKGKDLLQNRHGELQPRRKTTIVYGHGHEVAIPLVVSRLFRGILWIAVVVEVVEV